MTTTTTPAGPDLTDTVRAALAERRRPVAYFTTPSKTALQRLVDAGIARYFRDGAETWAELVDEDSPADTHTWAATGGGSTACTACGTALIPSRTMTVREALTCPAAEQTPPGALTDATPNRVDARTIRAALKVAGVTLPVRVTSGRNTTRVGLAGELFLPAELAHELAAVLRPLWNDDRVNVWTFESDGEQLASLTIERAGWHKTAPLEAELEVLEPVLGAGRVGELREDSTRAERVAELEASLPAGPLVLELPGAAFRLVDPAGADGGMRWPGTGALQTRPVGGEWALVELAGLDTPALRRHGLVRDLLVEADKRRRPIRHRRSA